MEGWIKLHRALQGWGWKKCPYHTAVFIDLLLEANHQDNECRGVMVPRGSLTTSIKAISERTGVTEKRVRTVLTHLKRTNEVAITTSSKFTMISIIKWDEYQIEGEPSGKQRANEGQTKGKRGATNKNAKNVKNEEKNTALTLFEVEPPQEVEELSIDEQALKVLTALNAICFKSFRATDSNLAFIKARINEGGYSLEDFAMVIKHKYQEWGQDPRMSGYLRPQTLFNGKFDGYLQSAKDADKPQTDPLDAFFEQYARPAQESAS